MTALEKSIIARLRSTREKQKISANTLASMSGVNRSTITHLEGGIGRPTLWVLIALCDALKVKLSKIVKEAETV